MSDELREFVEYIQTLDGVLVLDPEAVFGDGDG
jgi:hypothetical protein